MIASGLIRALRFEAGPIESSRAVRRALFADVAGLDAIIDEAIGESFAVRARAAALQAALSGLFSAISSWRTIESHLDERPRVATEAGAKAALSAISAGALPSALATEAAKDPLSLRERLQRSGDALLVRPAADISERLLLDQTGRALLGLAQTMNGIALLHAPSSAEVIAPRPAGRTFDPLVASLNGARVGLAIGLAC
jgi:Fusaric acid resistance protein family